MTALNYVYELTENLIDHVAGRPDDRVLGSTAKLTARDVSMHLMLYELILKVQGHTSDAFNITCKLPLELKLMYDFAPWHARI
jgi:hypothetical protein